MGKWQGTPAYLLLGRGTKKNLSDVIAQEDGRLAIGHAYESTVLRDREIPP